jgi:hypothetical protein
MCVHYIYAARAAESPDERSLAKIPAAGNRQRYQLHIGVLERCGEIPPVAWTRKCRRDNDGVARSPLRGCKSRHDGLEPPYRSGGEQMQNGE